MRRLSVPLVTLTTAALAAGSLTWASAARAADGLTVSASGSTLSVSASGQLGPGDIVIDGGATSINVHLDPDSPSALVLIPGPGCSAGVGGLTCRPSSGSFASVTISLMLASFATGPAAIAMGEGFTLPVTFFGSFDRDEFYGGSAADTILGYGGDDALFGGDGQDDIFGGDGADTIDGEGGGDYIYGDGGPDDITANGDAKAIDTVNCNNYIPGVMGSNNVPTQNEARTNDVTFDRGVDRVSDCGEPGAPGVTKAPSLTGTPTVGRNFVATAGTWTGQRLIMSYTWFACPSRDDTVPFTDEEPDGACAQVWDATGTPGLTYKPKASNKGKFLKLRSSARNNAGYWTVVSNSSPAVILPKR